MSSAPDRAIQMSKDCDRQELIAYGHPVMTPLRNNVAIGISLAQHEFKADGPIKLNVSVYNSGDAARQAC